MLNKQTIRKTRRVINTLLGRDYFEKIDCEHPVEWVGSDYGGWFVATDLIASDSTIYSAGVGDEISFDAALIDRYGTTIHAFDPSPRSIAWAHTHALPKTLTFHEVGLAAFDGEITLFPPENPQHVSYSMFTRAPAEGPGVSVPVKTLGTVMRELGHSRVDVLKLDIEGAEYQVLDDLCRSHIRPQQILVEFHHRFPDIGIEKTKEAVRALRAAGYGVIAVSDSGLEYTFLARTPS
jgi:FkbM family methyltransferase